jgi:dTDP-glucose 4,6-dehydratase
VTGSGIVFDACRRAGIARLLLMSTQEVYGPIEAPWTAVESDPLRPDSPHATSKAAADLLARSYAVTYGYPITVTRSTSSYGASQYPEKLLPLFITNLIDGERLPVYGDGSHVRDWLHVDDCCEAVWLALTDGVAGEVYNVGAGVEVTNLDLTRRLLEVFGTDDTDIDHVEDRPGHAQRYAVDTAAIRALGWSPQFGLQDGLTRTVEWYRANQWWWRPLKEAGASVRRGRLVAP